MEKRVARNLADPLAPIIAPLSRTRHDQAFDVVLLGNGNQLIDDTAHELHLQPAPFEPAMT